MKIFKCFLCDFESANKTILNKKHIGKTYLCPECKQSHGCIVETETQMEFPNDFFIKSKRDKVVPIYYGIRDGDYACLQVFEFISINEGKFKYGYCNVPGLYYAIGKDKELFSARDHAPIRAVGMNLLKTKESRNPKSPVINYDKKLIDDIGIGSDIIKPLNSGDLSLVKKLQEENNKLIDDIFKIDLYKVFEFDIEYLINCTLNFKTKYSLPKPLISRLKKKYDTTQHVSYVDKSWLNNLWHTYDVFYMGLPELSNIELWLDKAWKSKATCCGVVPFAPLSEWYKEYIIGRADTKLLKEQKGIPFPLVEFSYRYNPKSKKTIIKKESSLLTKEDKKLGQKMFSFTKDSG